jgi:ketosteroid isomerase-like protein
LIEMERAEVQRWLDDYVAAWKSSDPEAIAALFSEDCEYSYRPHGDTVHGREAIVRSWLEDDPDNPGTYDGSYEPFAVEGELAVAVGTSSYTDPEKVYDNCYLLRFDSEGRCSEFTEFFMKRQADG